MVWRRSSATRSHAAPPPQTPPRKGEGLPSGTTAARTSTRWFGRSTFGLVSRSKSLCKDTSRALAERHLGPARSLVELFGHVLDPLGRSVERRDDVGLGGGCRRARILLDRGLLLHARELLGRLRQFVSDGERRHDGQ